MSSHRKKSKNSTNIFTWIRQRTSQICYGVKTKDGNPAHVNKNIDVYRHFQTLRAGSWSRRLSGLRNADMADHFAGIRTYYFTADGRSSVPEVLVNIDIDCHYSGSLKGALAYAEHLKSTRFPGLYYETSTNGNGVHGYVVIEKGDLGDEGLNIALKQLDRWLKHELAVGHWDVEGVEVKGQAPEFTWGEQKYELKTYKSGQLAKLPREASTRGDELRGTTRVAVDELRRLKIPVRDRGSNKVGVGGKKPTLRKSPVVSFSKSENCESGLSIASPRFQPKTIGSITGRHFGEEELKKLKGSYLMLSGELLRGEVRVVSGRKVVKEEDLAVFLMLLRFFTVSMNGDGTLPTARWREMWTALYKAGDVERAWCHHRFAELRNFFSGKDLLSWEDEDYVIGSEHRGRYVPGRAAKWHASVVLMTMIDGSAIEVGEEEKSKSTLYGCTKSPEAKSLVEAIGFVQDFSLDVPEEEGEKGESILYGCTTFVNHFSPKTTRQPTFAEPLFLARLRADIPPQKPRFAGYAWQTTGMRMAA